MILLSKLGHATKRSKPIGRDEMSRDRTPDHYCGELRNEIENHAFESPPQLEAETQSVYPNAAPRRAAAEQSNVAMLPNIAEFLA